MTSFCDLVTVRRIVFLESSSKEEALCEMVRVLAADRAVPDEEAFRCAIFAREAVMTTGIGIGIAVPHARIDAGSSFGLCLGLHTDGIDFGSLDNQPVQSIAMIAQPDGEFDAYVEILAEVAAFLKNPANFNAILGAANPEEVVSIIASACARGIET